MSNFHTVSALGRLAVLGGGWGSESVATESVPAETPCADTRGEGRSWALVVSAFSIPHRYLSKVCSLMRLKKKVS